MHIRPETPADYPELPVSSARLRRFALIPRRPSPATAPASTRNSLVAESEGNRRTRALSPQTIRLMGQV